MVAAWRAGDIDLLFGALCSKSCATDLRGEAPFVEELAAINRAGHPLCARKRPGLDAIALTRAIRDDCREYSR